MDYDEAIETSSPVGSLSIPPIGSISGLTLHIPERILEDTSGHKRDNHLRT